MSLIIEDQQTRQLALDPTGSYIVQAPAGSGKTELLIQRYLKLLSSVQKAPEEIIAITFTRKAATEMRNRVVSALDNSEKNAQPPSENHKLTTWKIAKEVLTQDKKLNWHLQTNPNRLRILTIDSLCANLCAQLPTLANFGTNTKIIEDANELYLTAAERLLQSLVDEPEWKNAIELLLLHLDNRIYKLIQLLADILAKREQWLPHIFGHHANLSALREVMEEGLRNVAVERLILAKQCIPTNIAQDLAALIHYAAKNLTEENPQHPLKGFLNLLDLPPAKLKYFPLWLEIANLLLTQKREWRKSITKNQGFPSHSKESKILKEKMMMMLACLAENKQLFKSLAEILLCPPSYYDEQQWQIISALTTVLPVLTAQLHVIFQEKGVIDFIELNLGALRALGGIDTPSELALYLDYQIRHLLIDEFQDTSINQFNLIENLIAGWQVDDGRTLFLVGDPMQSIYRFRDAEVSLFMRTQQQGIGNVRLKALQLRVNFRSEPNVLSWINQSFQNIFPKENNIEFGAVPYTQSTTINNKQQGEIKLYPLIHASKYREAEIIIQIIRNLLQQHPNETIAILVRSRSQLPPIINALHENEIAFQAVDIEPLSKLIEIQDLVTLTRALLHLADRLAWLALLRAPWCGLSLQDLHTIARDSHKTIWQQLNNKEITNQLTDEGKILLQKILPQLQLALQNRNRLSLHLWIRGIWLALGGPATLPTKTALKNVDSYFNLLCDLEKQYKTIPIFQLETRLAQLFAQPENNPEAKVQIMTIHKSKGLEFDHVILADLVYKNPHDREKLLLWLERPSMFDTNDLILAPIKAVSTTKDPIYDYLRRVNKTKLEHEMARLFYVAVTRSKRSLHLLSSINWDEDKQAVIPPNKGSFLELLWKQFLLVMNNDTLNLIKTVENTDKQLSSTSLLFRLKKNWKLPLLECGINPNILNPQTTSLDFNKSQPVDIRPESYQARYTGTIIHETLQIIAEIGPSKWKALSDEAHIKKWHQQLLQMGLYGTEITSCLAVIKQAIHVTLNDPRGLWILDNDHLDAQNEYPLSAVIHHDEIIHVIIDRTFVDKTNTRWIVDYKTSTNHDKNLKQFLDEQQILYQPQLEQYAQIMYAKEKKPIKLALYFPLLAAWREWEFKVTESLLS